MYIYQKRVLPTLIIHLITHWMYNTLFPKLFGSFPQEANYPSMYKDWFPGRSRQKSALSSEGRLKEKCLILSRESSTIAQRWVIKFINSAMCGKKATLSYTCTSDRQVVVCITFLLLLMLFHFYITHILSLSKHCIFQISKSANIVWYHLQFGFLFHSILHF